MQNWEEDAIKADSNVMCTVSTAWFKLGELAWFQLDVTLKGTSHLCKYKAAARYQLQACHQHAIEARDCIGKAVLFPLYFLAFCHCTYARAMVWPATWQVQGCRGAVFCIPGLVSAFEVVTPSACRD